MGLLAIAAGGFANEALAVMREQAEQEKREALTRLQGDINMRNQQAGISAQGEQARMSNESDLRLRQRIAEEERGTMRGLLGRQTEYKTGDMSGAGMTGGLDEQDYPMTTASRAPTIKEQGQRLIDAGYVDAGGKLLDQGNKDLTESQKIDRQHEQKIEEIRTPKARTEAEEGRDRAYANYLKGREPDSVARERITSQEQIAERRARGAELRTMLSGINSEMKEVDARLKALGQDMTSDPKTRKPEEEVLRGKLALLREQAAETRKQILSLGSGVSDGNTGGGSSGTASGASRVMLPTPEINRRMLDNMDNPKAKADYISAFGQDQFARLMSQERSAPPIEPTVTYGQSSRNSVGQQEASQSWDAVRAAEQKVSNAQAQVNRMKSARARQLYGEGLPQALANAESALERALEEERNSREAWSKTQQNMGRPNPLRM